jgi:CDP-6-deoxy-D-xylo-4-hexulose-3-dehydrase
LEKNNIQTRNLFCGDISRHPCFNGLKEGVDYRIVGELKNTDKIMNDSFWVGVYPGMSKEALNFMIGKVRDFIGRIE